MVQWATHYYQPDGKSFDRLPIPDLRGHARGLGYRGRSPNLHMVSNWWKPVLYDRLWVGHVDRAGDFGVVHRSVSVTDNLPGHTPVSQSLNISAWLNRPPTITSLTANPASISCPEGYCDPLTITLVAWDPEDDPITCTWSATGGSLSSNTGCGSVTWAVPVSPGDKLGNVYVTDSSNPRIQRFTSTGDFIKKWGSQGSGDGQFSGPGPVAVDLLGNVYVVDFVSDVGPRIQKFTSTGTYVTQWGSYGFADGQFQTINGIAIDNSYVYVADRDRIQKFDLSGNFIATWGIFQFSEPTGIAVDFMGNVYVVDTNYHRIKKFTSTGTYVTQWGSQGSGDGQFFYPSGVAVDGLGNVYVADTSNQRIQKFTSTGTFITKWAVSAGAIAVDALYNVYAVGGERTSVQKFTSTGAFIGTLGSQGSGDGQFQFACGIAVDRWVSMYTVSVGVTDNLQGHSPVSESTRIEVRW